jgi:hypothetical protein
MWIYFCVDVKNELQINLCYVHCCYYGSSVCHVYVMVQTTVI